MKRIVVVTFVLSSFTAFCSQAAAQRNWAFDQSSCLPYHSTPSVGSWFDPGNWNDSTSPDLTVFHPDNLPPATLGGIHGGVPQTVVFGDFIDSFVVRCEDQRYEGGTATAGNIQIAGGPWTFQFDSTIPAGGTGGSLTAEAINVPYGDWTLTGAGSAASSLQARTIVLGTDDGRGGNMSVTGGATVSVANSVFVGHEQSSSGKLSIVGEDTSFKTDTQLLLGNFGAGELRLDDGGSLHSAGSITVATQEQAQPISTCPVRVR